ncbi:amidinotransferase, partial [Burkholderia pseudomallei]|nr:amidinotransferase [Burkholderia pseudomallei]
MNLVSIQAPAAVVMIRPHRFLPNPQTAADNAFQRTAAAGANDAPSVSA